MVPNRKAHSGGAGGHCQVIQSGPYVVGIVVDPSFGDRLYDLLRRMPVWIADTEINRAATDRAHIMVPRSTQDSGHTTAGAVTTFKIDIESTPEVWCIEVFGVVAGHHDRYSHSPGYSALE